MRTNVDAVVTVLRKSYGKVTAETRAVVSVTAFSRVRAYAFCIFIYRPDSIIFNKQNNHFLHMCKK